MSQNEANVVARLTPAGPSALATFGILGPSAIALANGLFHSQTLRTLFEASADRHYYGLFGGEVRDDVVLRVLAQRPNAEVLVHCHGGSAMVEALLTTVRQAGARQVSSQDYLRYQQRSEIEREAIAALAECPTARCATILLDQYNGVLQSAFDQVADHPTRQGVEELLHWARLGQHLARPWRVLLFGRPNVGKSSLLNAIAGFQRAIVSAQPGTTRDIVTTVIAMDGWPVELLDGAGLRRHATSLEQEGQRRLRDCSNQADLRILVADTSMPPSPLDQQLCTEFRPDLTVGNKDDLRCVWSTTELSALDCRCSTLSGHGLDSLVTAIAARLVPEVPAPGEAIPFTDRQVAWLQSIATISEDA